MERDLYAGDDTYVTWIGPRPVISVLACVPMNTEPEKQQEFFFVRKALETQTDGDGDVFSVRSVEPEFFSTLDLAGFPVVFLLGAGGRFQDVEWRLCRQYVEQGGWLVCTPGTRTLEQFRAIRENSLGGDEFAGVQQSDTAVQGVPFSVSWVNPEGPLAAYAADSFDSELFLFPIRKYARLRPAADTRVLLRAVTGDPLLVERPVGKGRFLQFAYGFDLSWSEMAMTTAFLPILREVATTAVPADFGTLRVECAGAVPDSLARVFRSDTRGGHRESLPDLGQPGVYKVRQTPVEVNISRQESVPEQIDIAALHRRFTGDAGGTAAPHAVAGIQETGWPLWPGLTAAAALLYLLEIVVASFLDQREMRRPQSVQDLPPTTARGGAAP
jgi:hypothetical protein